MEGANVPGSQGFVVGTSSIIAGNYDVNESTTTLSNTGYGSGHVTNNPE